MAVFFRIISADEAFSIGDTVYDLSGTPLFNINRTTGDVIIAKPTIVDLSNALHSHDMPEHGGTLVGVNALSDASCVGGDNVVVLTNGDGDIDLTDRTVITIKPDFDEYETPNVKWIKEYLSILNFTTGVVVPYFAGDANTDPGAVGSGLSFIVGIAWSSFSTGDIVERNAANDGWVFIKAASTNDILIVADTPVGDFSLADPYSIIRILHIPYYPSGFFDFETISQAVNGMSAIIGGDGSQYDNNLAIYDTSTRWTCYNFSPMTASGGLQKIGYDFSILSDVLSGATVAPLFIGVNGAGINIDNTTIIHVGGVLSAVPTDLSGHVPYTEASGNLDLGGHSVFANNIHGTYWDTVYLDYYVRENANNTITYNVDNNIETVTVELFGYPTILYTFAYDVDGDLETITKAIETDSWIKTYTYDISKNLIEISGWIEV